MENWISSTDRKVYIVLACITCKNVVLLTTKGEVLANYMDLFLPTVCLSYENDERIIESSRIGSASALWTSLSISYSIIQIWQPFLAIKAFLEGELSEPIIKVKLVQCNKVRDKLGSNYIVQSMLLDYSTGRVVQVYPYLQSGFF
jgi:hypothetical protein